MASKNMKTLLAGLSLLFALASFAGTTRYVSPDATGAADEDFTEEHPGTLQNAIAASTARTSWDDGDEIVLLPSAGSTKGIYDCTTLTPNMTRWAYFFCDKSYLKIRGYSGNRDDIEFRGFGDAVSNTARCFRVTAETSLSDFTIRDFKIYSIPTGNKSVAGAVNATVSGRFVAVGAAICSQDDAWNAKDFAVISNCAFYSCKASHAGAVFGGVIRNSYFYDCMFRYDNGKTAAHGGGGAASASCFDCIFDQCASSLDSMQLSRGGGTYHCNNTRCLFTGCRARSGAATGAQTENDSTYVNTDCVFSNNTVVAGGSGVTVGGISRHCLYIGNTGTDLTYGIARYCQAERCLFVKNNTSGSLVGNSMYNCLIANNVCSGTGTSKGLCRPGYYYNCTIVSNVAPRIFSSTVYAYNCLIAANKATVSSVLGEVAGTYLYNCVSDMSVYTKAAVTNNFEKDVGLKNGLRRGVDPSWGIPDMPVGIKPRASIKGKGSNLKGASPIFTASSLDYAGKLRLRDEDVLDVGCHAYVPMGLWFHLQ